MFMEKESMKEKGRKDSAASKQDDRQTNKELEEAISAAESARDIFLMNMSHRRPPRRQQVRRRKIARKPNGKNDRTSKRIVHSKKLKIPFPKKNGSPQKRFTTKKQKQNKRAKKARNDKKPNKKITD